MRLRSSRRDTPTDDRRSSAAYDRQQMGEMLNLDPQTTAAIAAHQASTGRLFGEAAVDLGLATPDQVRRAVQEQQGFSVLAEDDARVDPLVVSAFDPADPLAMSVRSLRSLISASKRTDGSAVQSVAIVGLNTGAETPILAANLAVACAQTGYRTLLVDADLTRPQQHALFRLPNRQGVSTMLSGASRADGVVQQTGVRGLSLVAGGPEVQHASELLDRRRLAHGLDLLLDDFDLILADGGDAASTGISAALGLDATIIVVRRDVTESRLLARVVDQLEKGDMSVLGTILVD